MAKTQKADIVMLNNHELFQFGSAYASRSRRGLLYPNRALALENWGNGTEVVRADDAIIAALNPTRVTVEAPAEFSDRISSVLFGTEFLDTNLGEYLDRPTGVLSTRVLLPRTMVPRTAH